MLMLILHSLIKKMYFLFMSTYHVSVKNNIYSTIATNQ